MKIGQMNHEWLFMNDWMKKENARAYGPPRAYRSTFMAWKTCQSLLEVSVENLSSDIPIHKSAMSASSYVILHPVAFAESLSSYNLMARFRFSSIATFAFTSSVILSKLNYITSITTMQWHLIRKEILTSSKLLVYIISVILLHFFKSKFSHFIIHHFFVMF